MPSQKRRRRDESPQSSVRDSESNGNDGSDFEVVPADSDVDISDLLTRPQNLDGEDDDIEDLIRVHQSKRLAKEGTEAVKRALRGKKKQNAGVTGGGSFQSMGLHPSLLHGLLTRGYRNPTPIQRASIPSLLATPPRDLVGMARTGSGKTLAYMVPLIQRLGGRHVTTFGARALILVPARELALQVMKVGKDLARGWDYSGGKHAGDNMEAESKKSQTLRWGLIVGGEKLDEQFEMITYNPDVIIATPGRLLHLAVEMNLELKSIQYVVFDEADRLFEMGFEAALQELIHRLPSTRQTVLFSATLPKSLVEFAKAGLQNPKLVRLDAESKISSDLRMAFFSVKQTEKDACLLTLLRDVIKIPLRNASTRTEADNEDTGGREASRSAGDKGKGLSHNHQMAPHQTLIFVATKHHVEYLFSLLTEVGYSVSHIYGALDQGTRTQQMSRFRKGITSILVVTDVAARGIDIPVLENVVNYDFPHGSRVFVHRVGRTARAGRKGWGWNFVTHNDLPRLLDLQLFLGRPLMSRNQLETSSSSLEITEAFFAENLILGTFDRVTLDDQMEAITTLDVANSSLPSLRAVMHRGHGMYERSLGKASQASYSRAKEMTKESEDGPSWGLTGGSGEAVNVHPVFGLFGATRPRNPAPEGSTLNPDAARNTLLRAVDSFRPSETIFEIGAKGNSGATQLMKDRRKALEKANKRALPTMQAPSVLAGNLTETPSDANRPVDMEMADEGDIQDAFQLQDKKYHKRDYRDPEFFMSHQQKDAAAEKGYSLKDGASFVQQAASATFDLTTDEALTGRQRREKQLTWDKKKKKWVKGQEGADNVKLIKTESGARLPASYVSGRFEEWKSKTKLKLPRVGEAELNRLGTGSGNSTRRFRFASKTPAKPLDPKAYGYERRLRQLKRKTSEAEGERSDAPKKASSSSGPPPRGKKAGAGSRFGGTNVGKAKSELKTVDQIRRAREVMAKKRDRNARPSRKRK
ncbi:uncharacterized protein EI90DRAFT_2930055 [Cantharellus anzutake]|uniref:uncharacterized protein n=1 Tax=Cantharellus anzutake TaxID=1750568 RepID=UPI001908B09A|nr:uncharacterized protein EI90DRAFT_2930055 [Cantharellus anzutake]KAF8326673.1 hypothetical protein EI90DRAFT_2930055 [Cantharellus anzutake]